MVLLLIETAAGFALFKVLKEKKLRETKVTTAESLDRDIDVLFL